jgi:peptide/nickel transport system substrate-binding protein
MPTTRRLCLTGAALAVLGSLLAACSGSSPHVGSGAANKGQMVHGGTVTIAELPGSSPNDIFPLSPATDSDGYNVNLTMGSWPTFMYAGDGSQSIANPQEDTYSSLTWSDNDSVLTITLKPWKWSDGVPLTSRDFAFTFNLLKANYSDWIDFSAGGFPTDVSKLLTPNAHTVVLDLNHSYNPGFYVDEELNYLQLLPQHVMDRESLTGPVGSYDDTTAGARAVWNFLQKQGQDEATFTTSPLWKVVYGPWRITTFDSDGYYVWTPNKNYSGPDKPILSKVIFTPFTTDSATMDTLRANTSLTMAPLPLNDLKQIPALEAEGYAAASVPTPGVAEIIPNLYNSVTGPLVRPLYIRQALEDLIDRPLIVSKIYGGYSDPGNGPVPVSYGQQWDTALEKAGGPYPYDPAKAITLLKAHGWKVTPGGEDSCQKPGSGAGECGTGITAGEGLGFTLVYSSGTATTDEMNADIQSTEELAGIKLALKAEPFNTISSTTGPCNASAHPAATCGWQMLEYGYNPYSLDPNGAGLFNTDGVSNYGGYSSPEMDSLINATEYGSSQSAFFAYENYAAQQLPFLWLPLNSGVVVYRKNLAGAFPASPFDATLNPEIWYYTKPAK